MSFNKDYWQANYSQPETMDGIGNAFDHSSYLKSLFALDFIEIRSIADFGYGLGFLFQEVLRSFAPKRAYGIEPSAFAFSKAQEVLRPPPRTKLQVESLSLLEWSQQRASQQQVFDLGLVTSVFQYLSTDELEEVLPVLAQKVRFLYLTVPTNRELGHQRETFKFFDEYAISRSRTFYLKLLRPHFTFISSRLLESKSHFDHSNTPFTEYLFRF